MGFKTWTFIVFVITQQVVIAIMTDRSDKLMGIWTRENDIAMLIKSSILETTVNTAMDSILGINVDKGGSDLENMKDLDSRIYSLLNDVHQETSTIRKLIRPASEYSDSFQESKTVMSLINSLDIKLDAILLSNHECKVAQSENQNHTQTLEVKIDSAQSSVEDKLAGIEIILVQQLIKSKSCLDLLKEGHTQSGIYLIRIASMKGPVKVYCDQKTDGGGWTVFQRRRDGSVDFYREWNDYKAGFGDLEGEFWLGNDIIHEMTTNECCRELRVDLRDWEGASRYAAYSNFSISSERYLYQLSVSGYSGTANDSLGSHNGIDFTTKDRERVNEYNKISCSEYFEGAWWFTNCYTAHLNGKYLKQGQHGSYSTAGIRWGDWHNVNYYSLPFSEMKFR